MNISKLPITALKTPCAFPKWSREDADPDLKAIKCCGHKPASNSRSPWLPCLLYVPNHHNLPKSFLPKLRQEPSLQGHDLLRMNDVP